MAEIVGYFDFNGYFLCPTCKGYCSAGEHGYTPVYDVNIKPYSQDCAMCREVIVKGQTETILFRADEIRKRRYGVKQ